MRQNATIEIQTKIIRRIPCPDRPARADVVRAGLAWIKNYTASPEFQTAYQKHRESRKPRPPEPVRSAEEQIAKMKAELEKGIENMRKVQEAADAARAFASAWLAELEKN
jgi:hypothetical protein